MLSIKHELHAIQNDMPKSNVRCNACFILIHSIYWCKDDKFENYLHSIINNNKIDMEV